MDDALADDFRVALEKRAGPAACLSIALAGLGVLAIASGLDDDPDAAFRALLGGLLIAIALWGAVAVSLRRRDRSFELVVGREAIHFPRHWRWPRCSRQVESIVLAAVEEAWLDVLDGVVVLWVLHRGREIAVPVGRAIGWDANALAYQILVLRERSLCRWRLPGSNDVVSTDPPIAGTLGRRGLARRSGGNPERDG